MHQRAVRVLDPSFRRMRARTGTTAVAITMVDACAAHIVFTARGRLREGIAMSGAKIRGHHMTNVSQCTTFGSAFNGAKAFNQPFLGCCMGCNMLEWNLLCVQ